MTRLPIPANRLVWPLRGAGLENLGRNGRPVTWRVPHPAPDQVLVRSDAVGLCYSDVKIIRQGGSHPRLYGRDLARRPVVQGHEVALTVVEAGEAWRDRFRPGDRVALQADIYYRGKNLAFGYVFEGGLAQYCLLGPAALDGDEGCYATPIPEGLGYAEAALTEPWACVEAAYAPRRRLQVKKDGIMWIVGRPDLPGEYRLGDLFHAGLPHRIIATDAPEALLTQLTWPEAERRNGVEFQGYATLAAAESPAGFDDIILLDPTAEQLGALPPAIAASGLVNLVGRRPLSRPAPVDVGRVHYDYVAYIGTTGPDLSAAYDPARNRSELRPGGTAWVVGGGGPMGRMHIQRMLQMPDGPRRVVVSETNPVRNPEITATFAGLALERGIDLVVLNPKHSSPGIYDAALYSEHGGRGFDDIVVIVASVEALEAALPRLAPDGLMVVFGGLARGTLAQFDLSGVYLGGQQITGSAGSTIQDQAAVLEKVASGQLSTANAVAAIGGHDAAREGMQGLMDGRFPGKIVIFPQVASFPLTALADLASVEPEVHRLLGPRNAWTREAELAFLRKYAPGQYDRG